MYGAINVRTLIVRVKDYFCCIHLSKKRAKQIKRGNKD